MSVLFSAFWAYVFLGSLGAAVLLVSLLRGNPDRRRMMDDMGSDSDSAANGVRPVRPERAPRHAPPPQPAAALRPTPTLTPTPAAAFRSARTEPKPKDMADSDADADHDTHA